MIYNVLAMINNAHKELSKLCREKSLQNHLEGQTSKQYIGNTLKNVHFKDQIDGQITQSSLQDSNITHLEKFLISNDLKE